MLRLMPHRTIAPACAENLTVVLLAPMSGDQVEPEFLEAYGHLDCQWKGFRSGYLMVLLRLLIGTRF